jgi:GNAT superfamily N-acetyltransferase
VIEVHDISECPESIDSLVSWNDDYWRDRTPQVGTGDWRNFYQKCVDTQGLEIPLTHVGFEGGQVVGAVTIVEIDDIPYFPDYSPWIAALIVGESFRGRDMGLVLMRSALAKVRRMGFKKAFLWTDSREKWYAGQGWEEIHRLQFGRLEAVVMKKDDF